MKKKSISQFVETEWKGFFDHISKSKNAFLPYEGLLEVERKVLYAAKVMHLNTTDEQLTRELGSKTGVYHISGEATVYDTIKSMASSFKRQHEVMLLRGVGAFPTSLSNTGAAARYTHVLASPLSMRIFEDADFCPYFIDDSGVEQPRYLSIPMPIGAIRTMKNIGIGKSCIIIERPHDQVYDWARKIIDIAYPGNTSGFAPAFFKDIKKSGVSSIEDIRNFESSAKHDDISAEAMNEIKKTEAPDPFIHTGCNVTYDKAKKAVWMEAKVEIVKEDGKTRYYITDLPFEVSDKAVIKKIVDSYPSSVASKVIDRSGEGHPIYLEIPKSIYADKTKWSALGLKKAVTEQYVMWNEELEAPVIYEGLYPVVLEWYKKREEVVTRKLYHKIATALNKIHNNELIKKYYDDTVVAGGKLLKTEEEVIAKYGDVDGRYLYNLPQKTYLPKNVEALEAKNKELKKAIKDTEEKITHIKEYIFQEWRDAADENVRDFRNDL